MDQTQCIELIKLYQEHRMLWDPKNSKFYNKKSRVEAWRNIAEILKMPERYLRGKMASLSGSYRREKSRTKAASRQKKKYASKWFAYDYFNFMLERDGHRYAVDTSSDDSMMDQDGLEDQQNITEEIQPEMSELSHQDVSELTIEGDVEVKKEIEENNHQRKSELATLSDCDPLLNASPVASETYSVKTTTKKRKLKKLQKRKSALKRDSNPMDEFANYDNGSSYNDSAIESFGKYVAAELKKYDHKTLTCVKRAIMNIIFDADMGVTSIGNISTK